MSRFTSVSAVAALEIQQLIADWGHDLDFNDCSGVQDLCTEDCDYVVGGNNHKGRAAIAAFYAARNARVRAHQRDGVRTQRHSISNIRVAFDGADVEGRDRARADFPLVNYSADGPAPALNLVGPTIIADCRMEFARGADGEWRIALFDSTPVFIGNDPFLNASVVKT